MFADTSNYNHNGPKKQPPPDADSSPLDAEFQAFLAERGLTLQQAEAAGIRPLRTHEIKQLTGVSTHGGGIYIPYLDETGKEIPDPLDPGHSLFRIRQFQPDIDDAGKPIMKYVAREGSGWGVYEPDGLRRECNLLIITEGELAAYAGVIAGWPVVGISGTGMFHDPAPRNQAKNKASAAGDNAPPSPPTHRSYLV